MTAYELKEYLSKDINELIKLLEDIGMHHIKYRDGSNKIICGMPDGDNKSSTSVYVDSLHVRAYTRDLSKYSTNISSDSKSSSTVDIYVLIMYIKGLTFPKSIRYIHKVLGLKFTYYHETVEDGNSNTLDMLKRFKKIKRNISHYYDYDTHPEFLLYKFDPLPHVDFIRDNILPKSYKKYDTRFDEYSQRIVLTHRKWDTGEIIGFFGRTTIPNFKELGIHKYVGLISFDKGGNLYGLNINYKSIQEKGYVCVFEAEKSVQQADSFGEDATCALCCSDITKEQIKILISLNVEIIFMFDKGITEEHIRNTCEKFHRLRKISYSFDTDNLLKDKESPTDNGVMLFEMLINDRIEYN